MKDLTRKNNPLPRRKHPGISRTQRPLQIQYTMRRPPKSRLEV
jgi:hypothetical protein